MHTHIRTQADKADRTANRAENHQESLFSPKKTLSQPFSNFHTDTLKRIHTHSHTHTLAKNKGAFFLRKDQQLVSIRRPLVSCFLVRGRPIPDRPPASPPTPSPPLRPRRPRDKLLIVSRTAVKDSPSDGAHVPGLLQTATQGGRARG